MRGWCWIATLAVLLGLSGWVFAQDDGVVLTFVGTPDDVFHDMTPTSDGGVVAVGYTTRSGAGGKDILLVKLTPDGCGDVLWRKTLGGDGDEEGRSVIELPGGDLAIAGHTSSIGGPGDHLLLSRLNSSGVEIWTRVLTDTDGNPQLRGHDLMRDSDGNLVVTGRVLHSPSIYSVLLAKFTSGGSFIGDAYYREVGLANWDLWGESVVEACDGDYIIVGGALYPTDDRWVLMMRVKPGLGVVEWSRFLQESGEAAVGHGAATTSDAKLAFTGETGGHLFISKRECSGTPVANWQKRLQITSEGHNIIQIMGDGLAAVGGYGDHVLAGNWNADGSISWLRGWGGGIGYGVGNDVENRIWVAGTSGTSGTDGLLAKLDPDGWSCYQLHYIPVSPAQVDWNPTEDVRSLSWHAFVPALETWPWDVDTHDASLQVEYPCDDECPEACCLNDGTCQDLTPKDCQSQSGQSQGAGTSCAPLGACCPPASSCVETTAACCTAIGGDYQGNGVPCTPDSCVQACCMSDYSCADLPPDTCIAQNGLPQGPDTTCGGLWACCLPDGSCETMDRLCCDERGGELGSEDHCLGDHNGNGIDDACDGAPVPTVSEWGLIIMTLLLLTAGTIISAQRRQRASV